MFAATKRTHVTPTARTSLPQRVLMLVRFLAEQWREICLESSTRFAEATLSWLIIGWAISFLMVGPPGEPMLRDALLKMAPIHTWTLMLLIVGLLKFIAVLVGHIRLRQMASLCAIWFWLFWTFVYWKLPYIMPGRFGSPILAFASILIFFHLVRINHNGDSRDTGRGQNGGDYYSDSRSVRVSTGNLAEESGVIEYGANEDGRAFDRKREIGT